ncbi:Rrf2 family transcriptional regulator [Bradyrhizobium tropiciagri]|uniref:RrF2 family transcriptional regulator n=1 Tax=Bradyrhizobium tropiciagri TaxID=312253 RepID=UPI001BAB76D0|nr:Rrf2 family transcriptional regulator [Bradyrhizobium tropiciagri]MBR0873311.1 Rrf2 family transcriptional regulator [Bradyrhizobium tropiciagri]
MAHIGAAVEYGLHCLIWLANYPDFEVSSRDLADIQGVPAAFVSKIFPRLEKAGIVQSSKGIQGGYRLAQAPEAISILDVVDAIEGQKPLFDCREIRGHCALFAGKQPSWSGRGLCGIHAAMLRAEKTMRDELSKTSLASLAVGANRNAPASFADQAKAWFRERASTRDTARRAGMRRSSKARKAASR